MQLNRLFPYPSNRTPQKRAKSRRQRKKGLSLALQGGGAFGAFTWGVLDRLLEEGVDFDTISGASSGAINALLLVSGLENGGADDARGRLERFWRKASDLAGSMKTVRSGLAFFPSRVLSPYQFNPLGLNPLRSVLTEEIDFESVSDAEISLLVAATRVRDGQLRIFRNDDIGIEATLASAALPMIHHAIQIDDEWYWDGGYSANPPVIPLAMEARGEKVLVVQVVPMNGEDLPRTPREINGRLAQITFNRSLIMELDMIAELKRSAVGTVLADDISRKLRATHFDCIKAEDSLGSMTKHSGLNLDWKFLTRLRDAGRAAADDWLTAR
jgi:NTE family protein